MAATDQNIQELKNELNRLSQEAAETQKLVKEIQQNQLRYPIDANSLALINDLVDRRLKTVIMDTSWKRIFRWYEPFDEISNWDVSPTGTVFVGGGALRINTGVDTEAWAARLLTNLNSLAPFDRDSYFRSTFYLKGNNPTQDSTYYLTVGDPLIGARSYYGFKVVGTNVFGVVSNAGVTAEVVTKQIGTVDAFDSVQQYYTVEARYYVGQQKIDFFFTMNQVGSTSTINTIPLATIRSPFAVPGFSKFDTPYLFTFWVSTGGALTKDLYVVDLDYIQKLDLP